MAAAGPVLQLSPWQTAAYIRLKRPKQRVVTERHPDSECPIPDCDNPDCKRHAAVGFGPGWMDKARDECLPEYMEFGYCLDGRDATGPTHPLFIVNYHPTRPEFMFVLKGTTTSPGVPSCQRGSDWLRIPLNNGDEQFVCLTRGCWIPRDFRIFKGSYGTIANPDNRDDDIKGNLPFIEPFWEYISDLVNEFHYHRL